MIGVVGASIPEIDVQHMTLVPLEGTFMWRELAPCSV